MNSERKFPTDRHWSTPLPPLNTDRTQLGREIVASVSDQFKYTNLEVDWAKAQQRAVDRYLAFEIEEDDLVVLLSQTYAALLLPTAEKYSVAGKIDLLTAFIGRQLDFYELGWPGTRTVPLVQLLANAGAHSEISDLCIKHLKNRLSGVRHHEGLKQSVEAWERHHSGAPQQTRWILDLVAKTELEIENLRKMIVHEDVEKLQKLEGQLDAFKRCLIVS